MQHILKVLIFIGGGVGLMAIFGTDVYERTFRESPGFARAMVQLVSAPFSIIFTYLSVRRLHDFNRSGWWSLIFSVPTPWAFTDYIFTALLLALFLFQVRKARTVTEAVVQGTEPKASLLTTESLRFDARVQLGRRC